MEGTSRTLPYTIRFVGLLGIHSLGRNPKFMVTAVDLGRELIRRRISLAYGGGNVGLQGAVASTVFTNGGLVRGFIPGYIATRRVYGPTYGVEHTVSSNYYKYFEMNHAVEAFIILPGGVDTMEGLFTLISWAPEGLHNRPIGLLNIDGYFNNLLKFLDDAVRQNFMALNQRKLFISSFFVDELLDKLEFAKAFPEPGVTIIGLQLRNSSSQVDNSNDVHETSGDDNSQLRRLRWPPTTAACSPHSQEHFGVLASLVCDAIWYCCTVNKITFTIQIFHDSDTHNTSKPPQTRQPDPNSTGGIGSTPDAVQALFGLVVTTEQLQVVVAALSAMGGNVPGAGAGKALPGEETRVPAFDRLDRGPEGRLGDLCRQITEGRWRHAEESATLDACSARHEWSGDRRDERTQRRHSPTRTEKTKVSD
ncbi:hypothetical protein DM860_017398 [Cuscuta australis]|uniref:cytokinin riboside 5'-monophosphate phosphoribohydrolase n=1 Tax=Cuscuta australis TaxID=267555 RepID=A0A328DRN1_9ASTE|nr:hypothetical protein DM860_017398 [Cuscuta australis]